MPGKQKVDTPRIRCGNCLQAVTNIAAHFVGTPRFETSNRPELARQRAVSRLRNEATAASRRQPKSKRLLSGLLRCGACGSGMVMTGCDRSGPRVRCSQNKESGSCKNRTKYYIEKIERLVLSRLKTQIDNPKLMGQFVEAYLAERRALSCRRSPR